MGLVPYDSKIKIRQIPSEETNKKLQELMDKGSWSATEYEKIRLSGLGEVHAITTYETTLGTYATKERALAVLDEIENAVIENQRIIYENKKVSCSTVHNIVIYKAPKIPTYQMPKE